MDHNFIIEHSETSDNRPYTTINVAPELILPEHITITPAQHVTQPIPQIEQDNLSDLSQRQESPQQNPLYSQLTHTNDVQVSDIQTSNPSETTTKQDTLELSEKTFNTTQNTHSFTTATGTNNTQNLTLTTDSSLIQIPTHIITEAETNTTNQQATLNITQEDTSVLPTNNTPTIQPPSTHGSPRQTYDPPSVPSQFATQLSHNSPQQGSSTASHTSIVHFQTPTPQSPQEVQPSIYTPAQTNSFENVQPSLNINTIHSNPPSNYTTSRHLSRPPLQTILPNPLSYNLTSTNSNQTQQTSTNNNQLNSLNNATSTQMLNTSRTQLQTSQFHIPNPPSTTIRTNPHIQTTFTNSITTNSNAPAYNTAPPSTLSHNTLPQPTYINASTSISEPIKPFDGLYHNYTPEEYLQHIEARVTFSLGLQPTSEHEYKFWHARRMAFIQCSLTGTALSWYIRLNETYKNDWYAFVQALKKQFSSQKIAYYAQVEALTLSKKDNETVRHFALEVQQLVEKGWCNENASTNNLKCNEIFAKGLPKNIKDFANKRQSKHTSNVLEPSIPFHTLVKLVDAEDIANDKIRTHDLALEINNITKHFNTQTLESSQEQLMFTQPKNPNNKNKPANKKYCSYCHRTNFSISACFKKTTR